MAWAAGPRQAALRILRRPYFEQAVTGLLVANALVLGIETTAGHGPLAWPLDRLDDFFGIIFVAEMALRITALGSRFFRNPWNWFDLTVVLASLAPLLDGLNVLRALRIMRAMRLIHATPRLRFVTEALLHALPAIGAILLLVALVFYIFGVLTTQLLGELEPRLFGTLGRSFFTLFQLMVLDGGTDQVLRPLLEERPWALLVLLPFILVMSFAILNLFVAVVVDALKHRHRTAAAVAAEQATASQLEAIRAELAAINRRLDRNDGKMAA